VKSHRPADTTAPVPHRWSSGHATLEGAFDLCAVGIAIGDCHTNRLLTCNPAYARLVGATIESLIGRYIPTLYTRDSAPTLLAALAESDCVGGCAFDSRLQRDDSTTLPVQVDLRTARDEQGISSWRVASIQSLEGRLRTQNQALAERERLAAIVETAMDAIICVNSDEQIVLANAVGEQMFGYAPGNLVGRSLEELIPKRFRSAHGGHVAAFRVHGVTRRRMATFFPLFGLRADGREFPIEASISKFAVNEELMLTAIVRDVSLQRRLKRDLLEAGDHERRRLGNDLHDELGPVLTGLRYLCDAARRRAQTGGSVNVADLSRISDGLASALTSMRLIARTLAPADVREGDIGNSLAQLARQSQEFFGIPCVASIDAEVAARIPAEVATSLYRIALEATNNAAKHACATQIDLILRGEPGSLELTVADDGRGMPKLDSAKTPGLGMRSMDYRAKLLGAAFTVTDRKPRGTAITCRWPIPA